MRDITSPCRSYDAHLESIKFYIVARYWSPVVNVHYIVRLINQVREKCSQILKILEHDGQNIHVNSRSSTCPPTISYKNPSLHYIFPPPRPFSVNLSKPPLPPPILGFGPSPCHLFLLVSRSFHKDLSISCVESVVGIRNPKLFCCPGSLVLLFWGNWLQPTETNLTELFELLKDG